ncbi:MAG: fumarate hydratase C-terminal domain-containing protein [Betaproteobacteria bacterium]|nr:fumarate hydratase C-terminal domain-containing protein [Betaproteobacteria bacterium]
MRTFRLKTPLTEDAVRELRVGDVVYLDGKIHTGRALVYQHVLEKGNEPPIDLAATCNVQMHGAPAGAEGELGRYRISSIQATASFRYARWVPEYVRRYAIRAVIGKGGMDGAIYRDVFSRTGTVFLTTVGYGIAAIYGRGVRNVEAVYWKEELGLPEAMWVIEVGNFGPFIVDGDCTGASLADQANEVINPRFAEVYARMPQHVLKRMGEIAQSLEDEVIAGNAGCPDDAGAAPPSRGGRR